MEGNDACKKRPLSVLENALNTCKNRKSKYNKIKKRTLNTLNTDCCLYKSKSPPVPEKYELLIADVPDLLEESVSDHYQGKEYDELVEIDPDYGNESKMLEERWTEKEIRNFELSCKLLHGRHREKNKIEFLKEKLPHKTVKELVHHYYIFHQPNFKKKSKQL